MSLFQMIIRSPVAITFFLLLILAGCAADNKGLDNSSQSRFSTQPGTLQDFTANIGDRIFFDLNSSSIRLDAQQTLARQAQWLKHYPQYTITIEGHADERGTREYNLALGQRRAVTTRDYLISQGVVPDRMRTISYGKERPVIVCDDISCWSPKRLQSYYSE